MKAKLIFDLEDPEDRMAHLRCIKSNDMAFLLFKLNNNLHRKFKYKEKSEEYHKGVNDFFEVFSELMEHYNLRVDELVE